MTLIDPPGWTRATCWQRLAAVELKVVGAWWRRWPPGGGSTCSTWTVSRGRLGTGLLMTPREFTLIPGTSVWTANARMAPSTIGKMPTRW
jgi:hypothetical protein